MPFKRAMLAHGGASSSSACSDGPKLALELGMKVLENGQSALSAVVNAVRSLEDDPRFNAGNGSALRADGRTRQMDASCMSSDGQFGAVACVTDVDHPIDIAQGVLRLSPHILLAGNGAKDFALEHKLIDQNRNTQRPVELKASLDSTRRACDTVGAVAFDGTSFAVALSSGGITGSALGRIGDVPLPGCGLFCGPLGAVACTGDGESIALKLLAREVYQWLEERFSPREAARKAMSLFGESEDVGLIILTKTEYAALSRHDMAWSRATVAN